MSNKTQGAEDLDSAGSRTAEVLPAKANSIQETETPTPPLNTEEKALLKKYETTIKAGLQTFHDVGIAFAEIRDRRLYREHGTFDEYCQMVWKVSRSKAYRYMAAARCIENLKCRPVATNEPLAIPSTEKQARKLAGLDLEQQVKVAKKVAKKTTKPTAKDFDEEVERFQEEKPRVQSYDIKNQLRDEEPEVNTEAPKVMVDSNLVPMNKIAEKIQAIYNIYGNSMKKEEGLKMFGELQRWVGGWVKWQSNQQEVA